MPNTIAEILKNQNSNVDTDSWKPLFFDPKKAEDKNGLSQILKSVGPVVVHDEINNKLGELVKTLNPTTKLKGQDLQAAIDHHVGNTPLEEYGMWVYYPWSKRLVHILGEPNTSKRVPAETCIRLHQRSKPSLREKKLGLLVLA